ncbi:unnamed protein product [Danaus chrysippus]|uniref:(African queen) hypothetical protein n=1 Tax=Danaus chrysippus TaxID=151541 RepID=A0A8J2WAP6_9NEOP|nr:unnamed protein product [Danaus chrysippus]
MTEARKVNLAKESFQRPPINSVKGSDGGGKLQTKHKNKIPKALRYDLENALVGLCDVWFEEIKPYLERNNIKLHVHGTETGGGEPEITPECSHLDPATSASQCKLCRLLFNASNSIESAVSQAASSSCVFSQTGNFNGARVRRKTASPSPPRPLVPRLCRTFSIPRNHNLTEHLVPSNRETSPKPLQRTRLRYPLRTLKQFRDASTQTDRKVRDCKKEKPQSPSIQKYDVKVDLPDTVNKNTRPLSPNFGKCQATTSFFSSKNKKEEQALFKDDLIDVIKEKHDKRLKILYKNPGQEEYPSVMNLFSPKTNNIILKPKTACKAPHWR